MPQFSFGHSRKQQILSGIVLSLLVAVTFLPAHTPAGKYETQSFSATAASHYDSPVAAILGSPDDIPEIRAGGESPVTGTPATRDIAPLNGSIIVALLFFAATFFSASFAGRASHPLYHFLDIPPPCALA
jgi:hypothetical protein